MWMRKCPKNKKMQSIKECMGCFYLRKVNYGDGDEVVCGYKKDEEKAK